MKQQAAESKAYIEAQGAEERKLLKIIAEADAERVRQKKELDQVSVYNDDVCYVFYHCSTKYDSCLKNSCSFSIHELC